MSVLNRYSNAEKYQGVLREFCNCQILNDKGKPGLFLKDEILTRIGWTGKVSDFMVPKNMNTCITMVTATKESISRVLV